MIRASIALSAPRRAALVLSAGLALAAPAARAAVALPGITYEPQFSGPAAGPHPTRADSVAMRYVGRFEDGEVFSTSPGGGASVSTFAVKELIPGMSAALQLMRPGDHWRIIIPPYLAYGPGRPFTPPAKEGAAKGGVAKEGAAKEGPAVQAVQRRGIPPDSTLVFDVELVGIVHGKAQAPTR
jgi:FKBP-type peptidyl-prolyl cis-trans isomerase